jgi:ribosomal protein L32E
MPSKKQATEAQSWDELEKLVDLQTVLKALKAYETSRLAHKAYNMKRTSILAKAKEMGITAD